MYITVAGIKRSGSTWQANLIRIICEECGLSTWMGEHYSLDEMPHVDVTINKIHPFKEQIAVRSDYVFTSWRPLREIRSSWQRFSGEQLSLPLQEQWLAWSHLWTFYSDYLMPFRVIEEDPRSAVEDVILVLSGLTQQKRIIFKPDGTPWNRPHLTHEVSLRLDIDKILERMETEVVPPTDKLYDERTCLFSNHITRTER